MVGGQCVYCAAQNIACSRAGSIIQPKATAPLTPITPITPIPPSPPPPPKQQQQQQQQYQQRQPPPHTQPSIQHVATTGMADMMALDRPVARGISPQAAVQDKALCFELVELYFKYIHDQLHSLFHRPSFMLDLHEGTAPLVLVYGMMAMSARYVCPEEKGGLWLTDTDSHRMPCSRASRPWREERHLQQNATCCSTCGMSL